MAVEDAKEKILTVGRRMGVEFRVLGFSGLNGVQRIRAGSLSIKSLEAFLTLSPRISEADNPNG